MDADAYMAADAHMDAATAYIYVDADAATAYGNASTDIHTNVDPNANIGADVDADVDAACLGIAHTYASIGAGHAHIHPYVDGGVAGTYAAEYG